MRFVSFDQVDTLLFRGKRVEIDTVSFLEKPHLSGELPFKLAPLPNEDELLYIQTIKEVIAFVKDNNLPKLVVSRQKRVDIENRQVNLSQTFINLCEAYPNAFVYFFIAEGKCWMGAFSEVLGQFDKKSGRFQTMSLAGTIAVGERWSKKEIEEQQPVTDFIQSVLQNYSAQIEKSDTYDHISGNIKHLRTDFTAQTEERWVENIIADLHPTPAVCGIPKEFCKKAISQFEHHARSFYAGYIKVETEESTFYFVNLRCAQFFSNAALLYVGGGITADSSAEKEWQETELKAGAILRNLAYSK